MRKVAYKNISIKDLAGLVCSELLKHDLEVTLTGGACVSIYSKNKYASFDLDFVPPDIAQNKIIPILEELGFKKNKGRYFTNSKCPFFIEFVSTPLSIGDEPVNKTSKIRTKYGMLRLLSPTDCIRDRLTAYYHWNDPQSLEQAIMVANQNEIDMKEIERWSKKEKMLDKFDIFHKRLKK